MRRGTPPHTCGIRRPRCCTAASAPHGAATTEAPGTHRVGGGLVLAHCAEPRKPLYRADGAEYAYSGGQTRRTWLAVRPWRRRCHSPARRSRRRTSASCTRSPWVRRSATADRPVRCKLPVRQRSAHLGTAHQPCQRTWLYVEQNCASASTRAQKLDHTQSRACLVVPPLPASACARGVTRRGSCWR